MAPVSLSKRLAKLIAATLTGLALMFLAASSFADGVDTVYLMNGGRIRGQVMVEDDKGVSVKLPDGTTRQVAKKEVSRVEYAPTGAAAAPAPPSTAAPVAPAVPPVSEEEPAPKPKPKRKHHYYADEDLNVSDPPMQPEQPQVDPNVVARKRRSAKGLVIAGAVLATIGWVGVGVGAGVIVAGATGNNDDLFVPGGIAMAASGVIALTGTIMLGVGSSRLRHLPKATPTVDPENPDPETSSRFSPLALPEKQDMRTPALTLTFSF